MAIEGVFQLSERHHGLPTRLEEPLQEAPLVGLETAPSRHGLQQMEAILLALPQSQNTAGRLFLDAQIAPHRQVDDGGAEVPHIR